MSDNSSSNNSRIAKNTLFLYLRMFLVLVVSLYTTRVVFNALGVVDYGIHNVVAGFVSMFAFLNTSMSNGIQRFYNFKLGSEGDASTTKVYNTALIIQGLLALIVVILLETVGIWYLNVKMVIPPERMATAQWIYQFSIISLVLVIMQIPFSAAIMAHERMSYYAYVSIIEVVLKLVFALLLPYVDADKLIVYGLYSLVVHILSFFLFFIYSKRNFKTLRFQRVFHKDLFKSMLSFSGWNIFGTFASMLKNQGLNVLLNAFFGPVVNAARGVSSMISGAILGFQSNIVISFRPQVVGSYAEGNYHRVTNLMFSLSKISYYMLYVISVPVIIELSYILHIWLGDTVPDYTVPFTVLVLLIMMVSALNTPLSQVVHASGKMRDYQVVSSLILCLILPVAWVLLKLGGNPVTVYWVSLAITCLNQVVCMLLLKRIYDYSIRAYIREVIVSCILVSIGGLILPVVAHFFMSESFWRLVVVTLLGVSSTAACAYLTFNKEEKQLVKGFVRKIIPQRKKELNT